MRAASSKKLAGPAYHAVSFSENIMQSASCWMVKTDEAARVSAAFDVVSRACTVIVFSILNDIISGRQ